MRKAIVVGLLLVFAWTSVVGAQDADSGTDAWNPFMQFLFELPRTTDKMYATSVNGDDWVQWPETLKASYVQGFITGAALVHTYAYDALLSCPLDTAAGVLRALAWFGITSDGLAVAGGFRFRVGVYVLELDVIYGDERNRVIPVMEAMYLANERLNGRDVDLAAWRTKVLDQEGA